MTWKRMNPDRCSKQIRVPMKRAKNWAMPARKGRCTRRIDHKGECSLVKNESPK